MMDYRYIEQLLERYWQCQATVGEERVLRAFFAQDDVPERWQALRPLFTAPAREREAVRPSEGFDERLTRALAAVGCETGDTVVRARGITLSQRLRPLWRSVASVAVLLTLGMAAEMSLEPSDAPYPGTVATRPQVSRGARVAKGDSVKTDTAAVMPTPTAIVK